jgi:hypothetical protein
MNPQYAIYCSLGYGPVFGSGHDICVANDSDANMRSRTNLCSYANNTGCDPHQFFTGAAFFRVQEIEVFQITG